MAIQSWYNKLGPLVLPIYGIPGERAGSTLTIDAVGESLFAIGNLYLSSGPGTSKVLSAAGGGKVAFLTASLTWANAATNLRVGVQDVASTGLEDGTFDVYADLVPGTDTLTADIVNAPAMDTGTKTIAHGDLVAIGLEMTARGGTDSVTARRWNGAGARPYTSLDTGAGPAKNNSGPPRILILFDDGTVGFLGVETVPFVDETVASFGSSSTPDEYALIFRVPAPTRIGSLYAQLQGVTQALDDFELILYSDPLGTPVAERTIVADADYLVTSGQHFEAPLSSDFDLLAGTDYAIGFRPTTTNTLGFSRISFSTGNAALRACLPYGTNAYQASRSNQTGAFGSADTIRVPMFGFRLTGYDDGVAPAAGTRGYGFVG